MSSPGFNATLDLQLRPSLRMVQAMLALHLIAIVLVFLAAPAKSAGLLLSFLILISWLRLRRPAAAGYGAGALRRLIWHADDDGWRVETSAGQASDARLLPGSVVWSWLIVLNFRLASGARRSRLLLGDEADAEQLRRLRARLLSTEYGA